MKILNGLWIILAAGLISACGGNDTCDEVQPYQLAIEGKRVVVPEDLDDLSIAKELTIPEPSAQATTRPASEGCIEKPPSITITGSSG